jgi:molecular chaperone GrpE
MRTGAETAFKIRGSGLRPKNEEQAAESPEVEAAALRKELADEKRKNEDLLTSLMYAQADFDNYRKRMDKETREASESMAKDLVTRLLVVQDELDLAAKHAEGGTESAELKEGIDMVRKNLEAALESVGVRRIDAVGKPFDPSVHEAVEKAQGDTDRDMVVDEIRPGFTFRGQLLRPTMVKVELASKATEGGEAD